MHRPFPLAVATVAALCLTACSSASTEPSGGSAPTTTSTTSTPTSTSTSTSTPTSTPTPTPTPTPGPSVTESAPTFEAQLPSAPGGSNTVFRIDGGYVAAAGNVVGFGPSGKRRWTYRQPAAGRSTAAFLADGVIVATFEQDYDEDVWPTPSVTVGLDPASGAVLWKDARSAFVSVHGDEVFTTACTGVQDGTIGNCTLSSRSARTGGTRWSIPTYHAAEILSSTNGRLLMNSRPEGGQSGVWTVLDATSGRRLSADLRDITVSAVVGDVVIGTREDDERAADGCHSILVGLTLTGERLWRKRVEVGVIDSLGDDSRCDALRFEAGDDGLASLASYDGRPLVVESTTGRTVWRGRAGEKVPVLTRSLLVAVRSTGGRGSGLRAVYRSTGREIWSDPLSKVDELALDGRNLLASMTDCFDHCFTEIRNVRTGKARASFAGALQTWGAGWVGTTDDEVGPVTFRVGES